MHFVVAQFSALYVYYIRISCQYINCTWTIYVNVTILRNYSGNGRACASSRHQTVFLLPHGLGTRLPCLSSSVYDKKSLLYMLRYSTVFIDYRISGLFLWVEIFVNSLEEASRIKFCGFKFLGAIVYFWSRRLNEFGIGGTESNRRCGTSTPSADSL